MGGSASFYEGDQSPTDIVLFIFEQKVFRFILLPCGRNRTFLKDSRSESHRYIAKADSDGQMGFYSMDIGWGACRPGSSP